MFIDVVSLGMEPAFEMVTAPASKTFFYRGEHKRVIEPRVLNDDRLRCVSGPLLYVVSDRGGVLRYVGKWVSQTPLYARWFRHDHIHHQTSSRRHYLEEIDGGRSPLLVWSSSAQELRQRVPTTGLTDRALVEALEALWIARWRPQLWNKNVPTYPVGFSDGEYWSLKSV
jgi:hypothetical protein